MMSQLFPPDMSIGLCVFKKNREFGVNPKKQKKQKKERRSPIMFTTQNYVISYKILQNLLLPNQRCHTKS